MTLDGGVHQTPGALTSTFRAVQPPTGPRVLRVALAVEGRIVAERRFDPGDRVTIGERPDVSFTMGADSGDGVVLGDRWVLFEVDSKGAKLRVPRGARGRARGAQGAIELAQHAGRTLALPDDARGALTLGDVTLLFSFEHRPPVTKAVLPLGVRKRAELDAQTFVLAALSFLAHFGAFGALYSDWADPVFDDDLTVSALLEAVHALPSAPLIVEEPADATANAPSTAHPDTKPAEQARAVAGARTQAGPASPAGPSAGARRMSDRDATSLSRDLAEMDVMMQGALGANGPSTDRVLRDDPTVLGMLDDVAKRDVGVRPGLAFGSSGRTDDLRGKAGTLADLGNRSGDGDATRGNDRRADGPDHAAPKPTEQPKGTADVPGANGVIARLGGAFHRCYQKGLDHEDPSMQGSIRVLTRVGPNGEVTSASPSVSGNLSAAVVACVQSKIMGAQFSPPTGGGTATLMIPVTLAHQ
jgi:hypothetical protein